MTPSQLIARWQARREEWQRLGAQVDGARLCEEVLADFESVLAQEDDVALTLTEAAELSGYSPDHLGRLVRQGTIPNAGRPGAPRIRRRDLPIRPGSSVATSAHGSYDPVADARKLGSRRKGGTRGLS